MTGFWATSETSGFPAPATHQPHSCTSLGPGKKVAGAGPLVPHTHSSLRVWETTSADPFAKGAPVGHEVY